MVTFFNCTVLELNQIKYSHEVLTKSINDKDMI